MSLFGGSALGLLMLMASAAPVQAKDDKQEQPFTGVSLPYFTDNILTSIILAKRANIVAMDKGSEFVQMQEVTIHLYQPFYRDPAKKIPDPTRPPRLKTKIIAATGFYKRAIGRRGIPEKSLT